MRTQRGNIAVCTNIVIIFLGDVRDPNSDMNMIEGLPDPTFGRADGSKTQWQLSIEKLEKDLIADLKEMKERRSFYNDYYAHR